MGELRFASKAVRPINKKEEIEGWFSFHVNSREFLNMVEGGRISLLVESHALHKKGGEVAAPPPYLPDARVDLASCEKLRALW